MWFEVLEMNVDQTRDKIFSVLEFEDLWVELLPGKCTLRLVIKYWEKSTKQMFKRFNLGCRQSTKFLWLNFTDCLFNAGWHLLNVLSLALYFFHLCIQKSRAMSCKLADLVPFDLYILQVRLALLEFFLKLIQGLLNLVF